ncbi:MAG: ChbG/HpnK family deacetylase [Bryobacterales bacterium]
MKLLPYLLLFACAASAQSAEKIRLIVRGDDFGYTHASNEALEPAFERGVMTSASMLVPGPWFAETARIVKQHPKWSVGVHLTITSEWNTLRWPPVAAKADVPSLVAPDGFLWGFGYGPPKPANWPADGAPWATHAPDSAQAEKEFRAQIERALAMGVRLDYVDCHMGMACREELLPVTQKLAKEFCLGISSIGMFGEQRFSLKADTNTPAGMKAALLKELAALQPGLYLYVDHPAADTPELRAVDTNDGKRWADIRSSVLAAWTDPEVIAMMKKRNIELTPIGSLFDKTACAPLR